MKGHQRALSKLTFTTNNSSGHFNDLLGLISAKRPHHTVLGSIIEKSFSIVYRSHLGRHIVGAHGPIINIHLT